MTREDIAPLETMLRRLAWRTQLPVLVLGLLLLLFVVGVIFLGIALFTWIRTGQLIEALRTEPARVETFQLHTRQLSPMGVDAFSTVFAVIRFRSAGGGKRTLRLRGRAADLATLSRLVQAVAPGVRVEDPETIRVLVV